MLRVRLPSAPPRLLPRGGGKRLALLLVLALTLVAEALVPRAARAQEASRNDQTPPGPRDDVERLYREGRAARDRGELTLALELLERAWAIRKTHDGAASLAQVEYELGRIRDAAEHLAYACEHLPAAADPERVRRLLTALEKIKQKIVTIALTVEPSTAEVTLEGRSYGPALTLPKELFATPGSVSLAVNLEGYEPWTTTFQGRAGDRKTFRIQLRKSSSAPADIAAAPPTSHHKSAAPLTPAPEREPRVERTSATPLIATASVFGVTLAGGVALWLVADAKENDANDDLARLGGKNRCGFGSPHVKTCADVRDNLRTAKTLRAVAYGAFAASALAAGVSYFVWPREENVKVSLNASIEESTVWASAEGRF